ncbi:MAG: sigma-70 family RNA polymerase sigma factor [Phycisphaerae bacterium]|nr:sigma-70 family RNA polymerase sigma factor [Phycisphaerae bacterium]
MTDKVNEKWLGKLLAGDHEAFAGFVDKYKETVFLCCRLLGLREDEIEDAASETFMAAYKGIRQYKGQAELSTWLWTIAYRKGVNYIRKESKVRQMSLSAEDGDITPSARDFTAEEKEQAELVWETVSRLPGLWAMAIVLFYREEKDLKEIAKIMRVGQNTVKTYLFRGRKRLKEHLAGVIKEDV